MPWQSAEDRHIGVMFDGLLDEGFLSAGAELVQDNPTNGNFRVELNTPENEGGNGSGHLRAIDHKEDWSVEDFS